MQIFAQLTKVDVEKREVWGRATQEVRDRVGEIFDYEESKPFFQAWSADFEKTTEGKSLGNVRAMHGKVAAGKLIAITFNDDEKAIGVGAKIVDDAEWAKCTEGVYTGFSIGGSYARKWADPTDATLTRFAAKPAEMSIVDLPCVPTALFTMVKADGVVEEVPFKAVAKGMWDVSSFADLLASAQYLVANSQSEASWEADNSEVPAQLRAWLTQGAKIFAAMAAEEVGELVDAVTPEGEELALAAKTEDLEKAGARHSKADMDRLQAIHDHAVGMGADCSSSKAAPTGDLAKVADLEKVNAELTTERETLSKRVKELEAQPAPAKGVLKVLDKADDITPPVEDEMTKLDRAITEATTPEARALLLIKKTHAQGGRLIAPSRT